MWSDNKARHVSKCLELGILLEVSADKPGNVNLITGFEGTRYEHFLASAVATSPFFELASQRGLAFSRGEIGVAEVGVGRIIKECVKEVNAWQSGGNTLLGTLILLSPIAVAAGMTSPMNGKPFFDLPKLRGNLKLVVESTTSEDAVEVYEAIRIANPSGLGKVSDLDVNDPSSAEKIRRERVTLFDVFKIASEYDLVCSEWVSNYHVTFDLAFPYLNKLTKTDAGLNVAVVHTFLNVLGKHPDTFIARKAGLEKAREVSVRAGQILEL